MSLEAPSHAPPAHSSAYLRRSPLLQCSRAAQLSPAAAKRRDSQARLLVVHVGFTLISSSPQHETSTCCCGGGSVDRLVDYCCFSLLKLVEVSSGPRTEAETTPLFECMQANPVSVMLHLNTFFFLSSRKSSASSGERSSERRCGMFFYNIIQ